jgi:amidohydrolase
MDALPVEEQNQTEYVSETPGKMHACGHDGHMTIGLALAKLFSEQRDQIAGRIKFVFQPAEEIAQGATAMMKDNVLGAPKPDVALGLHLWNDLPVGEVGIVSGPLMTACDTFRITIKGSGGHAALPEQTRDPIVAGAQIISALQTIVSRNVSGLDSVVVSVGTFHAGDADNVIPPQANLSGTFRTFRAETRDLVERRLNEIVTGIATAMGCEAEITSFKVTPPLVNDPGTTQRLRKVYDQAGFDLQWRDQVKWMAAEDMALFLKEIPGTYLLVGSANRERDLRYPHHHPRFDFDEDVLPIGVGLLATAVADYVLTA